MSFTRRIAKSALLTAAGAASVVGAAAGTAQAAELPQAPDLSGVTNLDGATQGVSDLAGKVGADLVNGSLPTSEKATDSLTRSGAPTVDATDALTSTVGSVTESATSPRGLEETPGQMLGGLPLNNTTLGGLPLS